MKFIWERAKIVIEPSAATVIAVLWEKKIDLSGLKVGVILSGGNVDRKTSLAKVDCHPSGSDTYTALRMQCR